MNGRRSKFIRDCAKLAALEHYRTLLDEEEAKGLTLKLAIEYTPTVTYVDINPDMAKSEHSKVRVVSENTMRWFIKQEKKRYG